jgi:hypothetical protein
VRRGAASCRACWAAVQSPRRQVSARGAVMGCERRRRCNPSEGWVAQPASPSSRPSRMSGRRLRRWSRCPRPLSAMRTDVRQLVGRTPGVQAPVSRCPGVRCPRDWRPDDRGDPGVPTARASGVRGRCSRAVRTTLDPGRRCGGTGPGCGWHDRRRQPWPPLGRRTGCGAALAAWPTRDLVQRQVPVGWLGSREGQVRTRRPGVGILGRSPACSPAMELDREW